MSYDVRSAHADVLRRIAEACGRARRPPETVQLVAVSKTFPPECVREALAAGQTVFGENRVQEALAKIPEIGPPARWHLIGHLQRNKARQAVGVFELIHGVDSVALANELDRRAAAAGLRQAVLLQVNVAGETTKSGVPEADLPPLVEATARLANLELRGLMTIPPPVARAEESRRFFARMRELLDRASERAGSRLVELSMGMSGDFEVAIEEGATLVRVGSAIFGPRRSAP